MSTEKAMTAKKKMSLCEPNIGMIVVNRAHDFHGLSPRDWEVGRLAAALEFFDLLTDCCRTENECYHPIGDDLKRCLNGLTVQNCIEMKAYHTWTSLGKKKNQHEGERDSDYLPRCKEVCTLDPSTCKKTTTNNVHHFVLKDLRNNYHEVVALKGHYAHLANTSRSYNENSCIAHQYTAELKRYLEAPQKNFNIQCFIERYQSVMSVYELLGLYCAYRTASQ